MSIAQLVERNLAKVEVTSRTSLLLQSLNVCMTVCQPSARVVELVDTRDLKSLAGNSVPVHPAPGTIFKHCFCNEYKVALIF